MWLRGSISSWYTRCFSLYLILIKLEGNLDWNLNEVLYLEHMTVFCLDPGTLVDRSKILKAYEQYFHVVLSGVYYAFEGGSNL